MYTCIGTAVCIFVIKESLHLMIFNCCFHTKAHVASTSCESLRIINMKLSSSSSNKKKKSLTTNKLKDTTGQSVFELNKK